MIANLRIRIHVLDRGSPRIRIKLEIRNTFKKAVFRIRISKFLCIADPDPLVRDTYGSGSLYNQAKLVRKSVGSVSFWPSGSGYIKQKKEKEKP
jgi:hypothetical protein